VYMNQFLNTTFSVTSLIKSGAPVSELVSSQRKELNELGKNDVIVFCGGANDMDNTNVTKGSDVVKEITKFIQTYNNTNIVILGIPHRFDLKKDSRINLEIQKINTKLRVVANSFRHVSMIEMEPKRGLFTKHGLHFNKAGKEKLAKSIANLINQTVLSECNKHPKIASIRKEKGNIATLSLNKIMKELCATTVNPLTKEHVNEETREKTCATLMKPSPSETVNILKEPYVAIESRETTGATLDKSSPTEVVNVVKEPCATMENLSVKEFVNGGIRDTSCANLDKSLPSEIVNVVKEPCATIENLLTKKSVSEGTRNTTCAISDKSVPNEIKIDENELCVTMDNFSAKKLVNEEIRYTTCTTSDKSLSNEILQVVKDPCATMVNLLVKDLVYEGTSDATCDTLNKTLPSDNENVVIEQCATMENPSVKELTNEGMKDKTCTTSDNFSPSGIVNEIRTSERPRKTPITRSSDFLW